jgi:serine/threonine protein kinase
MTLMPGTFTFNPVREIGRGGLGTVQEVVVTATNGAHPIGARLALKKLNAQWANHPEACARFEREIQLLRKLDHPGIVKCVGENLHPEERFYFMPLYPNTLRQSISANPKGFELGRIAGFAAVIADALAYAHAQGMTHRDLKPDNILLAANGQGVVADWGLGYFVHKNSTVLSQHLTAAGMGTEYYCSLEQWNTGKCGHSGDIYSLGLTIAECLCGAPAQIKHIGAGIQHDLFQPSAKGGTAMNALLRRMTEMISTRRIQSMTEVAVQLRDIRSKTI